MRRLGEVGFKRAYADALRTARVEMDAEWDRTRHADDPQKLRPIFSARDQGHQYAMLLMRRLRTRMG